MRKEGQAKAHVHVRACFKVEGLVLAQTVRASLDEVQTHLEMESTAAPDRVANFLPALIVAPRLVGVLQFFGA